MSRIRNNHLNWKIEEKYYFTQSFDTDDSKFKDFPLIVFFSNCIKFKNSKDPTNETFRDFSQRCGPC